MTALKLLIGLLMGRNVIVPRQPRPAGHSLVIVEIIWNPEIREFRVISSMSRYLAFDLHSDLLTVPEPQETTTEYTHALGQVLHTPGGQA
ncbi:hypothetical protein D3875_03795 [Deinococcus cavernae]|uniref:Uncharacterized protein n=1 Tax=Deinococcus cavernae TaxID=2320857 RepID=A0A418VE81_9DEIO|nr:hypothetical protein [Deinococcus cavernae]RJF74411.1 hypothetical protein D3875_03795 [Deinococcus cavernae]